MYETQYYMGLYGIQRSGNHAIISWILQQSGAPQAHFNNVALKVSPILKNRPFRTMKPKICKKPLKVLEHTIDTMIVSYESRLLNRVTHSKPIKGVETANYYKLLLLRDFENWLISYIKLCMWVKKFSIPEIRRNCRTWIQYAREFIGLTNHLSDKITINYNEWYKSEDYRIELAKSIPSIQQFDPDAHKYIPLFRGKPYGKFETKAKTSADLGVMNRRELIDEFPIAKQMHEEFPEAMELSKQIFGA